MEIKKEVVDKIKEVVNEDHPEISEETIEKYMNVFLQEESTMKHFVGFMAYCRARKIEVE